MPTTYYVDPSIAWLSTQAGTATGTAFGGIAGMKKAMLTVAAGDTVMVRGGAITSPTVINSILWVIATTTSDHSATWAVGDVVRNFTGSGNDWTGTIYSIALKVINVSIDTGDYTTVDTADNIENTTRSENDTFTKAVTAQLTLSVAGTAAAKIRWVGCDTSWVANAGYVKILTYTTDRAIAGNFTGQTWENFIFDGNLISNGYCVTNTGLYLIYRNCLFQNCVRYCHSIPGSYAKFINCTFYGNTDTAYSLAGGVRSMFLYCKFFNAAGIALALGASDGTIVIGCIFHNSVKNHMTVGSQSQVIMGCVCDTTGATYSAILCTAAASLNSLIMFNRIVNSATYAIECDSADQSIIENWNYFQSNSSGNLLNILAGANSIAGSDTNCGFADPAYATSHDFRLATNASGRRTSINMDFDLATPLNYAYPTMGLPPTDMIPYFGSKSGGK